MSKKNKVLKRKLKAAYGDGCFFERAHISERIEAMGGIKTFKVFVEERRYSGKSISYQLTVHHLKHRSNGGENTVDNCANVAEVAHQYMHSLSFADEEIINEMLREFKVNFMIMKGNGQVENSGTLEVGQPQEYITIPVYDTTLEQQIKLEEIREARKQKQKYNKYKNPSRAAKKREMQRLIEEEEYEID